MLRSFVELIIILCNLPCNCRNELRRHIYTLLVTSAFIAATLVVIFDVVIPSDVYRAKVLHHLHQRIEGQASADIVYSGNLFDTFSIPAKAVSIQIVSVDIFRLLLVMILKPRMGAGTTGEVYRTKICFALDLLCIVGSNIYLWVLYPSFGAALVCIMSCLAGFFEALAKHQSRWPAVCRLMMVSLAVHVIHILVLRPDISLTIHTQDGHTDQILLAPGLQQASVCLLAITILYFSTPVDQSKEGQHHVTVVVMGDVGRSPRMQYHCLSLAAISKVALVGMRGEPCIAAVAQNPNIDDTSYLMWPVVPKCLRRVFVLTAPIKVIGQFLQLMFSLLLWTPHPRHILLQIPPSIPTMAAVWVASILRPCKVICDWHNFGYTIMQISRGPNSPFVRVMKANESFFSRRMDSHLCVTKAMREWIQREWRVRQPITVLYDRAPEFFKRLNLEEMAATFLKLEPSWAASSEQWLPLMRKPADAADDAELRSLFTYTNRDNKVCLRPDRPALVVSSTSWTKDEDFGILLNALVHLSSGSAKDSAMPRMVVVITGKGPQKAFYQLKMTQLREEGKLNNIDIYTMWLEAEDYPKILGAADIGVCLHTSSSGLDLPMKVVDMFGAGLPVLAVDFGCIGELVEDGHNGFVFDKDKPEDLSALLTRTLSGLPGSGSSTDVLRTLRAGVLDFQRLRWRENWNTNARPLFA